MNETIWLPDGFGKGTIIYDKLGKPWEATERVMSGVGIYEVKEVEEDYAQQRIKEGVGHLVSEKE